MPAPDPGLAYRTPPGRWVIAATVLGSGMGAIDATVVGIALPAIGRDFHASVESLQWVASGYTLTLGALLLFGGALGDRYGRRRIFGVGVAWFAVASVLCSLAPDASWLVGTRILQGIGAALLTPGSLAILQASFRTEDRGRAIGAWSGLGGLATAIGPLLGGYLIAAASWRWIFLINLPVGLLVLAISMRHVPESHDPDATSRPDLAGACFATLALGGVSYALIEGPSWGWASPRIIVALVVGLASVALFLVVERRSHAPMLPLSVFRSRQFSVTNVVTLVVYAALGGALFLLPVELQIVNHYSPLRAGASLLPLTAIMLALSARSGRLAGRIGPRLQMSVGPIVAGAGLALLARSTSSPTYAAGVLPGVVVLGLGLAITVAPLTITALGSVRVEHAGVASAVNNDVARIGSLLAVAVLPALAGITGSSYLHENELAEGFRTAMYLCGAACVAGGAIAALWIRNPVRTTARVEPVVSAGRLECLHCALDATPLAVDDAARPS